MSRPIGEKLYEEVKKAACRPVLIKTYPTGVELAKLFEIAPSTVYRILKTKSYKEYLSYPYKRRLELDFIDTQNESQRQKQVFDDFNNEWFFGGEDDNKR